jgi:16S rRNA (guanine966-N2)-methyltransferase
VRKSLFDVLGKDVIGKCVLDLFAGSGALGAEALSRGAASVLFVDEDAGAVRMILANLADLGLIEGKAEGERRKAKEKLQNAKCKMQNAKCGRMVEVWRAGYRWAVRRMKSEGRVFDLILMDPPYRKGLLSEALQTLTEAGIIAPAGLIAAEAEARLPTPEVEGLALIDERIYGDTKLIFWSRRLSS